MTTILLMGAGAGKRMNSDVPKPCIEVNGVPMWMHVADKLGTGFVDDIVNKTFVTRETCREHVKVDEYSCPDTHLVDDVTFIPDMSTLGPAWSVVAATLTHDAYTDVLILDSDCFLETGTGLQSAVPQMLKAVTGLNTQALVFGARAEENNPHVATIKNARRSEFVRIQEGGVDAFGLYAIGAYWFRSMSYFRYCLNKVDKSKEAKISDVINACGTGTVECPELQGRFVNLGTEELLAAYCKERGFHGQAV